MPNRYVCDVLDEIRKLNKARNYGSLLGMVEEVQTLVNRMEAALGDKAEYQRWHDKAKEEKAEYKKLLAKSNKLRKKKDQKEASQY